MTLFKNVCVVGAGISGLAATEYLLKQGVSITLYDQKKQDQFDLVVTDQIEKFKREGVRVLLGEPFGSSGLAGIEALILSPGVSFGHPLVIEGLRRRLEMINEPELAFREIQSPVVAVTGSSGKTTTTTLIGEMLKANNPNVFVGGNIGTPLIRAVLEGTASQAHTVIAELSSFQIELISSLKAKVAVFTTLEQDHLDRYDSFESYLLAKRRLIDLMDPKGCVVLNAGNAKLVRFGDYAKSKGLKVISYAVSDKRLESMDSSMKLSARYIESDHAIQVLDGTTYSLKGFGPPGMHFVEDAMAAVLAALEMGGAPKCIQEALSHFKGLPHRLEYIGDLKLPREIKVYNDSKATNVISVEKSLTVFPSRSVHLLMGGRAKDLTYGILRKLILEKCLSVSFFGESRERLKNELYSEGTEVQFFSYATLGESVSQLKQMLLKQSDFESVILLSPGCTSLDAYRNYAERGEFFKKAIFS